MILQVVKSQGSCQEHIVLICSIAHSTVTYFKQKSGASLWENRTSSRCSACPAGFVRGVMPAALIMFVGMLVVVRNHRLFPVIDDDVCNLRQSFRRQLGKVIPGAGLPVIDISFRR